MSSKSGAWWRGIAKSAAEINAKNGFYQAGSGTVLETIGVVALIGTEVEEARGAIDDMHAAGVSEELADAAIRTVSVIFNLVGDNWNFRVPSARSVHRVRHEHVASAECEIYSTLMHGIEQYRKTGSHEILAEYLEFVLRAIVEMHDAYCPRFDIGHSIEEKLEVNSERPYMHGKKA